jgi:hypothetical protein
MGEDGKQVVPDMGVYFQIRNGSKHWIYFQMLKINQSRYTLGAFQVPRTCSETH